MWVLEVAMLLTALDCNHLRPAGQIIVTIQTIISAVSSWYLRLPISQKKGEPNCQNIVTVVPSADPV